MSIIKKAAQLTAAFAVAVGGSIGVHKAADHLEQRGYEQGRNAGYAQGYGDGVSDMNSIRFEEAACDDFANGIEVVSTDDYGRTRTKYGVIPSDELCGSLSERRGKIISNSLNSARQRL